MRLPQRLAEIFGWGPDGPVFRPPPLPPEQVAVASWLRGDEARCRSLVALLDRRVTDRGTLPFPSNPHEVFANAGRDREAREIALLLLSLCTSPIPSGSGSGEVYEREPSDSRGLGS